MKRLTRIVLSLVCLFAGLFSFSACGEPEKPSAQIVSFVVELDTQDFELIDDTITVSYGTQLDIKASHFKVTATLDDGKTKILNKKTRNNPDGFEFYSSIPQSYTKVPVNTYEISFRYGELEEYIIAVKVVKADIATALVWNYNEPLVFSGEEQSVGITNVPEGVDVSYTGIASATNVGEYSCTANFTCLDSYNYNEIDSVSLTWEILPATITVETPIMKERSYNESPQTAEIDEINLPDNVIVKELKGTTTATIAGEYDVEIVLEVVGEGKENYIVDPISTKWTIAKSKYTITGDVTFVGGENSFVYSGHSKTVEIDYTDLESEVGVVGTPTNLTATNVGVYTVEITLEYLGNDDNYLTEARLVTLSWSITPAPLKLIANDCSITYGDNPTNDGFTCEGLLGEDGASVLSGTLRYTYASYSQFDNVGTYENEIVISGVTADNYDITFVPGDLTVRKKVVVVTPNNSTITYNTDPVANGITATGFVGDDDQSVLKGEAVYDFGTYVKGDAINGKVGSYDITVAGLDADNYFVLYVGTGKLIVSKANVDVSSVSLNESAFTYNESVQSVSVNLSSLPTGVTFNSIVQDKTGRETINAGSYTAVVKLDYVDKVNYNLIPDLELAWKINKAKVDISSFSLITKTLTYNGKTQSVQFTDLPKGAEFKDYLGEMSAKNVGLYTIQVVIGCSDKDNYIDFNENKSYTWNILPATLIVTANSNTITYGEEPSNNGVVYSGFKGIDNEGLLEGEIIYTYNYSKGQDKGSYTISIKTSTVSSDNYDIVLNNGTLTVDAKVIDLTGVGLWQSNTTHIYDGQAFKPELIDVPEGIKANYSYFSNTLGGGEVTPVEVGDYYVTVTLEELNSNYVIKEDTNPGIEGISFSIVA